MKNKCKFTYVIIVVIMSILIAMCTFEFAQAKYVKTLNGSKISVTVK